MSDIGGSLEPRVRTLEVSGSEFRAVLLRIEDKLAAIDARISTTDARISAIEGTLRGIELSVAELKGRVSQLPTTLQMIMFVLGVLVIAGVGQFLQFRFPRP